jgi:tRNA (mo5U34)-methyltransferase
LAPKPASTLLPMALLDLKGRREQRRVRSTVDSVRYWFHSIDVGQGVVTPGQKPPELLDAEWNELRLPDLTGKTVLDVGAWDGYFSFRAEASGAARVVALDHYAWSLDVRLWNMTHEERYRMYVDNGFDPTVPVLAHTFPGIWRPDTLPGKQGFDVARELRGSTVEDRVGDLLELDLDELGAFDVVLYLGVLYHMEDPFLALRKLRQVTRELAVIETASLIVPGFEDYALCEFYPTHELNMDPSNWWTPNPKALVGMCRAAGFSHAEVVGGEPPPATLNEGEPAHSRIVVQARV